MSISPPASYVPPAGLAEMVRLARLEATALLAETRSALLLVDVQNRFLYEAARRTPPLPHAWSLPSSGCSARPAPATCRAST